MVLSWGLVTEVDYSPLVTNENVDYQKLSLEFYSEVCTRAVCVCVCCFFRCAIFIVISFFMFASYVCTSNEQIEKIFGRLKYTLPTTMTMRVEIFKCTRCNCTAQMTQYYLYYWIRYKIHSGTCTKTWARHKWQWIHNCTGTITACALLLALVFSLVSFALCAEQMLIPLKNPSTIRKLDYCRQPVVFGVLLTLPAFFFLSFVIESLWFIRVVHIMCRRRHCCRKTTTNKPIIIGSKNRFPTHGHRSRRTKNESFPKMRRWWAVDREWEKRK